MKRTQYCYAAAIAALCLCASQAQADGVGAGSNTYGFGLEGFDTTYKESDIGDTSKVTSGSFTGYFSHQMGRSFFAIDGRGSYGTENYSAIGSSGDLLLPSGSVNSVPQWEFEMRARYGRTYQVWDNGSVSPYIGLGIRYLRDEGKGYFTDTGAGDFDSDTWQFYIPIGASYTQSLGDGWSITPLAEGDIMFYGDVTQHITNIANANMSADNEQHFGIGGRGEVMFGKDLGGYDVEIGPFVRYWWIQNSDTTQYTIGTSTSTLPVYQPSNTSTEIGGTLRFLW